MFGKKKIFIDENHSLLNYLKISTK